MARSTELLRQLFTAQTARIKNRFVSGLAGFDGLEVLLARTMAGFTPNAVRELIKLKLRTAGRVV